MMQQHHINHVSGISEAIGFILIFGIVMAGTGMVALYGYPVLQKAQQNAEIKNMERAFLVLQSDMNSLVYKNIPYHETNIQVMGGTMFAVPTDSSQFFTILKDGSDILDDGSGLPTDNRFYPNELRFKTSDGQFILTLENGAVNSVWGGPGSTVFSDPRWFYDSNNQILTISLIKLSRGVNCPESKSDGPSRVEMNIQSLRICDPTDVHSNSDGTVYEYDDTIGHLIQINYIRSNLESDYSLAWHNFFQTLGPDNIIHTELAVPPAASTIVTFNTVKRLIIKGYEITITNI